MTISGRLQTFSDAVRLYGRYFLIHIKSVMQYKTSFFLTCLGQFFTSFNVFLGIYFMFRRFHTVKGYTYQEVLLCYSIVLMAFTLAEAFARGFDTFSSIIGNGTFDRIMVRPRGLILQVLGQKIEFTRSARLLQAVIMLIYGLQAGGVLWTPARVLTVVLMIAGGTALFSGLFLIYASICFFTLEGLEFMNVFTDGAREHGKYPFDIYGKRFLLIVTFLIPYACIQYYPLLFLLGRGKSWYAILPLAGFLFLLPCYVLWRIGVRHYQSTGS